MYWTVQLVWYAQIGITCRFRYTCKKSIWLSEYKLYIQTIATPPWHSKANKRWPARRTAPFVPHLVVRRLATLVCDTVCLPILCLSVQIGLASHLSLHKPVILFLSVYPAYCPIIIFVCLTPHIHQLQRDNKNNNNLEAFVTSNSAASARWQGKDKTITSLWEFLKNKRFTKE